ncbi:MAG TPA: hypothetical protein VKV05_13830 [Terriglobales bacterium]|nr:hypothetical protein [Terriglobales bacterium]
MASRGNRAFPPAGASTSLTPAVVRAAAVRMDADLSNLFGVSGFAPYSPQVSAAMCSQALPSLLAGSSDSAFDHMQFTAAAFKGAFSHQNLVKMAHNFVPGQPWPDEPSYVPLTNRQKFDLFFQRSHSYDTVSGAIFDSINAQITGGYPSFGGGMAGYGRRLAAATAGAESANFFGTFALPALFHQDPRYFRSNDASISDRLAYAASRVVIGRSDDGRSVLNTSLILSQFVQAAVSNAYVPYGRETVSGTITNALTGLGSVAQARILNEFWPDIKAFLSHHEPKVVHHWQDKWDNSSLGQFANK